MALVFFSGCIGTRDTIASAIPSTLTGANVCGHGLWGDWVSYSVIASLIGFFLVALIYMLGEILQKPDLTVGAKDDFYQTAVSLVIVANAVWIAGLLCSDLSAQLLGFQPTGVAGIRGLYDICFSYLNWLNEKIISGYVHVLMVYWRVALATSFYQGNSPGGIGANAVPFSGLSSLLSGLSMMLNALTIAWITNLIQIEVLKFVMLTSLTVWLPLGIVCRCFKPTRRFGGALMALGLGLFFFYPIEIGVNAAVAQEFTDKLSEKAFEGGTCYNDNDCCAQVAGACQLTPPVGSPTAYSRAGGSRCSVDNDCYSKECVGATSVRACDWNNACKSGPCSCTCIGGTGGSKFLGRCASGICADRGWCKPCLVSGKLEENAAGIYDESECCTGRKAKVNDKGEIDPSGSDWACRPCSIAGDACRNDLECCAFKPGRNGICEGVHSCATNSDCASNNCESGTCTGVCDEETTCSFDAGVGASSASSILKNTGGFAVNGLLTNAIFLMYANLLTLPFKSGLLLGLTWAAGFAAVIGVTAYGLSTLIGLAITLFVTAFILPTINLILVINLVRDLSKFLGEEMDISNLTRMI